MTLGAAVDRSRSDLDQPELFLRRLQECQDYEAQKQQVRQEGELKTIYKILNPVMQTVFRKQQL